MAPYRVASPLQHDGTAYAVGDVLRGDLLTPAQIAHLTACGTLVGQAGDTTIDPHTAAARVTDPAAAAAGEGASPPSSPAPLSPGDEDRIETVAMREVPIAKKGVRR